MTKTPDPFLSVCKFKKIYNRINYAKHLNI